MSFLLIHRDIPNNLDKWNVKIYSVKQSKLQNQNSDINVILNIYRLLFSSKD